MIHILLVILKIIGILLAVILGLAVLLICIVLFVPVRYEGKAVYKDGRQNLKGKIRFSWLLHLIAGYAQYEDEKFTWKLRIAWKQMNPEAKRMPKEEIPAIPAQPENPLDHSTCSEKPVLLKEPEPEKTPEKKTEKKTEKKAEKTPEKKTKTKKAKKSIVQKIKYTFHSFCDRIKLLRKRKDRMMEFIHSPTHKSAFKEAKKGIIRLICFLKPKRFRVHAHYGFEDPSTTGMSLAYFSLVYPFIGKHIWVQPDFEQAVFEGDVLLKGHIRMVHFAAIAGKLLLSKNIRQTYKDIKKMK